MTPHSSPTPLSLGVEASAAPGADEVTGGRVELPSAPCPSVAVSLTAVPVGQVGPDAADFGSGIRPPSWRRAGRFYPGLEVAE